MQIPQPVFHISKVASTEAGGRYPIDCVRLAREGDECTAVANDGRRLLEVRWKDDCKAHGTLDGFVRVVPPDLWVKASHLARSSPVTCRERYRNTKVPRVTFVADNDECVGMAEEKPYPRHTEVIPQYSVNNSTRINVNARLLAELLTTMINCDACSSSFYSEAHEAVALIVPDDPTRPLKIVGSNGEMSGVGVLMPINPKANMESL